MPRPMASKAQDHHRSGYETGSMASRMTLAQRRAFYAWLKQKNLDSRTYEQQLAGKSSRRSRDVAEV